MLLPGEYEHYSSKKYEFFRWTSKHKVAIFQKTGLTILIKFR
jgi:hypothetical protein